MQGPRLAGETMETGALAWQVIDGHPLARDLVAEGGSALARFAARLPPFGGQRIVDMLVGEPLPRIC